MSNANPTVLRSILTHLIAGTAAVVLLVAGMGGWAYTTEIAGAIIAPGVLVVDSNVKKVQHPSGGVVRELLVDDGDHVTSSQLIVRLDDTQARANLAIFTKRLDELVARQAREEAERDGASEIAFPAELTSRDSDPELAKLIAGQRRLFEIRRNAREGERAQLAERINLLKQEIAGLEAQAAAKLTETDWIRQELEGVTKLWQKNLIQFPRLVSLQRDVAKTEGERAQLVSSIAQAKNKIAEIELQILQIDQDLRAEVGKDLASIRAEIAETSEQKIAAEDVLSRIDIRAPQEGTVHEMTVHTVGGVVAAGEPIMMIVPLNDTLDVEAKIAPESINQVRIGQRAVLRFSSFDQRTTPEIDGVVTRVSPDLIKDAKTNEQFYLVRIGIAANAVANLKMQLVPGMPVESFIKTDVRTVLSYLMKPLNDQVMRAFRER